MNDPSQTIFLRQAIREDAPHLADLTTQLGNRTTSAEIASSLRRLLQDPEHHLVVACAGEGPAVAWIHVFLAHRLEVSYFAEIGGLVVDRELRGRGVGGLLVEEAARWARERDCDALRVRSNDVRRGAHGFFLNQGFGHIKTQKIFQRSLSKSPGTDGPAPPKPARAGAPKNPPTQPLGRPRDG